MNRPQLQRTANYSKFVFDRTNRDVDVLRLKPQHKKLRESMRKHGFLAAFPIMVKRVNGRWVVVDGQHRLTFAKEFGLDVFFVVDDTDVDVADLNQAQANWSNADFAKRWAANGNADYQEAIQFSEQFGAPLMLCFGMLAGTTTHSNISKAFRNGEYRITRRDMAYRVVGIHQRIADLCQRCKGARLIEALWACCHLDYFEESRIIETLERRPSLLSPAGTRDDYLDSLEEVYNFGRKSKAPLRFDAEEVMKQRKANFGRAGKEKSV